MRRVKDEAGNIVFGVYKDNKGALIVNNPSAYEAYLREKQQGETLNNLRAELDEMKLMLAKLIQDRSNG